MNSFLSLLKKENVNKTFRNFVFFFVFFLCVKNRNINNCHYFEFFFINLYIFINKKIMQHYLILPFLLEKLMKSWFILMACQTIWDYFILAVQESYSLYIEICIFCVVVNLLVQVDLGEMTMFVLIWFLQ